MYLLLHVQEIARNSCTNYISAGTITPGQMCICTISQSGGNGRCKPLAGI